MLDGLFLTSPFSVHQFPKDDGLNLTGIKEFDDGRLLIEARMASEQMGRDSRIAVFSPGEPPQLSSEFFMRFREIGKIPHLRADPGFDYELVDTHRSGKMLFKATAPSGKSDNVIERGYRLRHIDSDVVVIPPKEFEYIGFSDCGRLIAQTTKGTVLLDYKDGQWFIKSFNEGSSSFLAGSLDRHFLLSHTIIEGPQEGDDVLLIGTKGEPKPALVQNCRESTAFSARYGIMTGMDDDLQGRYWTADGNQGELLNVNDTYIPAVPHSIATRDSKRSGYVMTAGYEVAPKIVTDPFSGRSLVQLTPVSALLWAAPESEILRGNPLVATDLNTRCRYGKQLILANQVTPSMAMVATDQDNEQVLLTPIN